MSDLKPLHIFERANADTITLVQDVVYAATVACNSVSPSMSRRHDAAKVAHAIAALVEYRADQHDQVIKMPHQLLAMSVGDCKSTAILCAMIGSMYGANVDLCFLQYDADRLHFAHVFAILDGVACDPLLPLGETYAAHRRLTVTIQ